MPTIALTNLIESRDHRNLALFIGTDLPSQITSLPSRADIAQALAKRYGLDERLTLADVAARVGRAGSRFEFTDFLRNALDTAGKPPQPFHQQVARLMQQYNLPAILTTAYDNLLETAFSQIGAGINRIVRSSDVSFARPDRPSLIKLYGDAQQPETLVVTDLDHADLLRERDKEQVIDEARQVFRRNTVLFLGYNLADPDFQFVFGDIAQKNLARTAYAALLGLSEIDRSMWQDRKITILDQDPLAVLSALSDAGQSESSHLEILSPVQEKSTHPKNSNGALPSEFYTRLRKTLMECGPFESNARLRAVFVHEELSPWRNGVSEADSLAERVDLLISYLAGKRHSNGKLALAIFLNALVERVDEMDVCSEHLKLLVKQIEEM